MGLGVVGIILIAVIVIAMIGMFAIGIRLMFGTHTVEKSTQLYHQGWGCMFVLTGASMIAYGVMFGGLVSAFM